MSKKYKISFVSRSTNGLIFPSTVPNIEKDRIELINDFYYTLTINGNEYERTLKKGFDWDGSSIPKMFWATSGSPYQPKFRRASLVHDDGFKNNPFGFSRNLWNEIYLHILGIDKVSRGDIREQSIGLKIGSWIPWNRYRKAEKKKGKK